MKWVLIILFPFLYGATCQAQTHKYYFDFVAGNDAMTAAQAQNIATPWKTLTKLNSFWTSLVAGDSALLKRNDTFPGFIIATKSGTAALSINVGAYGTGASPVINGFYTVPSWTSIGGGKFTATITGGQNSTGVVLLNGNFQAMAKYPKGNAGYYTVGSYVATNSLTSTGISGIPSFVGGEIVWRPYHWVLWRGTVNTQTSNTVAYTPFPSSSGGPTENPQAGYGFFFQNHPNACTALGDWAYNTSTHVLTMYFGASVGSNVVKISTVDSLISTNGQSYLTFSNLTLQGANVNAFWMPNSNHITIRNCNVNFSGRNAVNCNSNCNNMSVLNSNFNWSNSNTLFCYSPTWTITGDTIINTGATAGMGGSGEGEYFGIENAGNNSVIKNCAVYNSGYIPINFNGTNSIIQNNFVDSFAYIKDDAGGIYWGGFSLTGTVVNSNIIINGIGQPLGTPDSPDYRAYGIYNDDGGSAVTITNNSTAYMGNGGIYDHAGFSLTIRNNTFFDSHTSSIKYYNDANTTAGIIFAGNICFALPASELVYYSSGGTNSPTTFFTRSDSNYWCRPINENNDFSIAVPSSQTFNLAGWRTFSGQDAHSKITPITITNINQVLFVYNPTLTNQTTSLPGNYIDVKSNAYPGSITLTPYTSAVLLFQSNIIPLGVNISQTSAILCNGGTTTLNANVTGGVVPYTYLWSTAATTPSITGVAAGTYSVKVTDANSTVANASYTVSQPTAIVVSSVTYPAITINGHTTSDTIHASGGTGTLTYSQNGSAYQSSNIFTGVAAGNIIDTVKDANGCKTVYKFTITQPSVLVVSSTQGAAIICHGGSTTDTVKASGGTAPYTGTGVNTVTAGTYTYTVTDAAGAQATTTITITQPSAITISEANTTITINGGTSTVTITASGGTGSLQYKLGNNGTYQSSNVFTGVLAGTDTIFVKDANSCTNSLIFTITQPSALVVTVTSNSIACNGGTAVDTVKASGGTPPYTGTGTHTVTVGSYSYTVTDAGGATATGTITIGQPTAITISLAYGSAPTTVTVTAGGGAGGYTYALDAGSYQGSNSFALVGAGNHTSYVKDANGCINSKVFTVGATLAITASAGTITCNGGTASVTIGATGGTAPYTGTGVFSQGVGTHTYNISDNAGHVADTTITLTQPSLITMTESYTPIATNGGSTTVTINASGGTGSYTYSLDGGAYQGSNSFAGVLAGNHTIATKDANGCIQTASFTLTQPGVLGISVSYSAITCYGGTTSVTITGNGGTAPLTVIGGSPQTKGAGNWTFSVTDAFNNRKDTNINITQPSAIVVSVTTGTISVNGGTTTVTATAGGGTGSLQYSLDGGAYQGTGNFSGVAAGLHSVTVEDANNCTQVNSFSITQPGILYISATVSSISCYGGSSTVVISASGGTPGYTGTGTFTKTAGTYLFHVVDTFGAVHDTSITITQPPIVSIIQLSWLSISIVNGTTTLHIAATGGTGTLQYKLDGGSYQMADSFTTVLGGNHIVYVQDGNGCTISQSFTMPTPSASTVWLIRSRAPTEYVYIKY